jgi:hypothetical protein
LFRTLSEGWIDGIWGVDTQSTLERFQQTHGLPATGQLNQATVGTLGLPAGRPSGGRRVTTMRKGRMDWSKPTSDRTILSIPLISEVAS